MNRDWIDVSTPLAKGMDNWTDNPPFMAREVLHVPSDGVRVLVVWMGSHSGTHVDAASHVVTDGVSIDAWHVDATVGPARVVALTGPRIVRAHLEQEEIGPGDRILFKTRSSHDTPRPVFITCDAAVHLASRRPRAVGFEAMNVEGDGRPSDAQRILLEAGIWIIAGLDLSRVGPGKYDLMCLPLRIAGGDAAPARALLRLR
jgi:arylformamidase